MECVKFYYLVSTWNLDPQIAGFNVPSFDWKQKKTFLHFSDKNLLKDFEAGARMSPSAGNKGLLMTYFNDVYSFYCESNIQCYWKVEEYELKIKRRAYVMITVPSSLVKDCNWYSFSESFCL